jgi:hypothetical protein
MPEGLELDDEIFGEFAALAKEHSMPQAEAQKYADIGAKMVQKAQEGTVEHLSSQWTDTLAKWVDEIKTDKEIGGENLPKTLSVAQKALATFGTPELRQVLEETGMTNNPALVRCFYAIGVKLGDDTFHSGQSAHAGKSLEQILYPTMQ